MNLFHLNGFNADEALDEWSLVFKRNKGYVEKKDMYKCIVEVAEDSHEYSEVQPKNGGDSFVPDSNEVEEFTVFVKEKPVFKKFSPVTIDGVENAYVMGKNKNYGKAYFEANRLVEI